MAKELIHDDAGSQLSRAEDNAVDRHYITGGEDEDILVYDLANLKLVGKTPAEVRAILGVDAKRNKFYHPVTCTTGFAGQGDFGTTEEFTAAGHCRFNFAIPKDFSSLVRATLMFIGTDTGTMDWTVTTSWGTDTETYNTHSDSATADGATVTNAKLGYLDITAAFTGLALEDVIGTKFLIDAVTDAAKVKVLGIRFEYLGL